MLTKIKRFLVLVMAAFFVVVLVGCDNTAKDLQAALDKINIEAEITSDSIDLPNVNYANAKTVWTSSDDKVISIDGSEGFVTQTDKDQNVTLTVKATVGDVEKSKNFEVVVKALAKATSVKIDTSKFPSDDEGVVLEIGKSYDLNAIINPEDAYSKVEWTSSRSKVAKIEGNDEDGYKVTALSDGKCKITVKSASDGSVQDVVEVFVAKYTMPQRVLTEAVEEIKSQLPKFISATTVLPSPANEYVTVKYIEKDTKLEVEDNEYVWHKGVDRREEFEVVLSYRGAEINDSITLQIVNNPDDNEFLALEEAEAYLQEFFKEYITSADHAGKKITAGSMVVPTNLTTQYGAEDAKNVVSFAYEPQYFGGAFSPVKFTVEADPADSTKNITNLVCVKPNDDVSFRIRVDLQSEHVYTSVRLSVTAAGYTKDEIVEYLKANSFPQADAEGKYELSCANVTLATADTTDKFKALEVSWKSSNTEVLSDAGRFVNIGLSEDTEVKLTATINYKGTVSSAFAFTETVEYTYMVKPAANNASIVAFQLSNVLETEEFLSKIKYFPFGDLSRRTSEEAKDENVMPLPKTIGEVAGYEAELANYKDLAITWSTNEEGVLDENHKLLKQYLRYHEVTLTYSVTVEDVTATNEIVINIGIAEMKNTKYYGGWFNIDQSDSNNPGDVLGALSKFDATVGKVAGRSQVWGTTIYGAKAAFGGYTYYVDVEVDGVVTRHQFYTQAGTITKLGQEVEKEVEGQKVAYTDTEELTTANGTVVNGMWAYKTSKGTLFNTGKAAAEDAKYYVQVKDTVSTTMNDNNTGGNWGLFFVNTTDHDIMVPMSPYTGGGSPKVDADGAPVKFEDASDLAQRENGYSFDGYRVGVVMDKDGNVVFGNSSNRIQDSTYFLDANGELSYFVTIPAGGYGMTYKTMYNNLELMGAFAVQGNANVLKYFEPFHISADGNNEGLGSLQH
ncbi:MAG: immunoglobulin-like domain-containing protein [Bacilli bacterium]|nr:Ig-like domain-containing protein [Acholeplasmataceae bacterium]MDY2903262.1 immunoglobulin-like domain-containing protein [Bacilli bacterium]